MPTIYHKEHLLDRAAMLAIRETIALLPRAPFGPAARPGFDAVIEKTPAADGVAYEAATVGGVPGWWCRPEKALAGAALLYLHGGAYVVGSAAAYRNFAGQIAKRAGASTFVADYALAPERPFPAAFDDATAAYLGLAEAGFIQIALVGDSAGGGLALALLASMTADAIRRNSPVPSAAAVISPWLDLTLAGQSMNAEASADPILSRERLAAAASLYLGARDSRDPRASTLEANLAGLPSVILHVGEDEVLLDDARRYTAAIEAAQGNAELHIWQGMVHVFPANLALLHAAPEALDLMGDFIRKEFGNLAEHEGLIS